MNDDDDNTDNLKAPEVAATERQEKPRSRWNDTGDRVRRHPIGVAVGAGVAGLLIGGVLGAGLFGGPGHKVGPAGVSSPYAAAGSQCLGGPPPPPPGGQFAPPPPPPGGPGGPGGPGHGGPGGPGAGPGGPGGPAAPGAPGGPRGQGGPGVDQTPPGQQPGAAAPAPGAATPSTPLLPAEQPAR